MHYDFVFEVFSGELRTSLCLWMLVNFIFGCNFYIYIYIYLDTTIQEWMMMMMQKAPLFCRIRQMGYGFWKILGQPQWAWVGVRWLERAKGSVQIFDQSHWLNHSSPATARQLWVLQETATWSPCNRRFRISRTKKNRYVFFSWLPSN
jgi:hypothetical protein